MSATLIAETTAALPIEPLLEQLRAQGIRIPRPAEVRDYLTRYPDVIASVRNASAVAVPAFAGKAVLSLELYVDPEIEDRYLTLYVRQNTYDQDIMERIERVWESYDCELDASSGWFLITTDFQPPGETNHEL
jgi:hypothetical protein